VVRKTRQATLRYDSVTVSRSISCSATRWWHKDVRYCNLRHATTDRLASADFEIPKNRSWAGDVRDCFVLFCMFAQSVTSFPASIRWAHYCYVHGLRPLRIGKLSTFVP
jgi:hypothetical protein